MSFSRLLGLAVVLAPVSAYGQTRNPFEGQPVGPLLRDDVAGSRQIPGYEPEGVKPGALTLLPTLTGAVDGDTNVLNVAANMRQRPQMVGKHDPDHGNVCTSTDTTCSASRPVSGAPSSGATWRGARAA